MAPRFLRRRAPAIDYDELAKALTPAIAQAAANGRGGVNYTPGGATYPVPTPSSPFSQTGGGTMQTPLPRVDSTFNSLFGPGYPMVPDSLDPTGRNGRTAPRRSEYLVAWNLQLVDRQVPWTMLRWLAEECDVVNRCIQLKQDELCGYDWSWGFSPTLLQQIMADTGETNSARATAIAREQHGDELNRVQQFFESPDRDMGQTFSDWLQAFMWDHLVYDGVAIYPSYNLDGSIRNLELVDASTVKIYLDNRGRVPQPPSPAYAQILYGFPRGEFQQTPGEADDEFSLDQLGYYIRRPRNTSIYGYPQVEEVMALATTYLGRQSWMRAEYTNGVVPRVFMETAETESWTPEQLAYYERVMNDRLTGQIERRQSMFMLRPGFKPTIVPQIDEHYKSDYDDWLIGQIASRFGVAAQALGVQPKHALASGKGQTEGQTDQVQEYSTKAMLNWVIDVLNDLARRFLGIGPEITATVNGAGDDEDHLQQTQADVAKVGAGLLKRNEWRAKAGLPLADEPEADQLAITTAQGVQFLAGQLEAQQGELEAQAAGHQMAVQMAENGQVPGQPAEENDDGSGDSNPDAGSGGDDAGDSQPPAKPANGKAPSSGKVKADAKAAEKAAYARFLAKDHDREFVFHHHDPYEVALLKADALPSGGAKLTKQQANYRPFDRADETCHVCRFRLDQGDAPSLCAKVDGTVDRRHVCDLFEPEAAKAAYEDHPGHKLHDKLVEHYAPLIADALTANGIHAAITTAKARLNKAMSPEDQKAAADAVNQAVTMDPAELRRVLARLYGEAGLAGTHAAAQSIGAGATVVAGVVDVVAGIDWANWQPGDANAASLVERLGLDGLLDTADVTIKGITDAAMGRLTTALVSGLSSGDSVETIARDMSDVVADPARSLMIANTETARAMTESTMNTYAENGVAQWQWIAEPDACPLCLPHDGQDYDVGGDDEKPPLHPNCRCAALPVVNVSS